MEPSTRSTPHTAYTAEIQRIAEEQSAADHGTQKPDIGTGVLTPYAADRDAAAKPLYMGITLLIAALGALCIWAFIDVTQARAVPHTTVNVPAADCPLPTAGRALIITVVPTADAKVFQTSCRTERPALIWKVPA